MWENKSVAGADPHPFWTWLSFIYMLSSATFPLNVHIIWLDPFYDRFSSYNICVCNHCHQTNQNRLSMMRLTSHLSSVYDAFSSCCVSSSLMTSLSMMVMRPGDMVRALFHLPLKIPLVVWVAQNPLVMWVAQNPLVVSVEYFQLVASVEYFLLVVSVDYFPFIVSVEY